MIRKGLINCVETKEKLEKSRTAVFLHIRSSILDNGAIDDNKKKKDFFRYLVLVGIIYNEHMLTLRAIPYSYTNLTSRLKNYYLSE